MRLESADARCDADSINGRAITGNRTNPQRKRGLGTANWDAVFFLTALLRALSLTKLLFGPEWFRERLIRGEHASRV